MADIDTIREQLGEVYMPEGVELWLTSRNGWLDNQRPVDLINDGRADEVQAAVDRIITL